MSTNVFLGGSDPLLSTPNYSDYDKRIAELQQLQAQQKQMLSQPQQQAPIWAEIESITSELSDREFAIISNSEEFRQSEAAIAVILNREYMRVMRPIVEATQDGKEALQAHLNTIKRLRKQAASEADKSIELFTEYTQNYSDMTYSEFLKMKKGK